MARYEIKAWSTRGVLTFAPADDVNLIIDVEGYEDFYGNPSLIALEEGEDGLTLFVWADKEQEDPTHRISLERCYVGQRERD